jgi:hypothetical protein
MEIVPRGKPLRWRRYDVAQHLTPKTSDALRFCAVEGDLELHDRRHRSTIETRVLRAPHVNYPVARFSRVGIDDLAAHIAGRERCDAEGRWGELQLRYRALASKLD